MPWIAKCVSLKLPVATTKLEEATTTTLKKTGDFSEK
jgi:hypothetical protein